MTLDEIKTFATIEMLPMVERMVAGGFLGARSTYGSGPDGLKLAVQATWAGISKQEVPRNCAIELLLAHDATPENVATFFNAAIDRMLQQLHGGNAPAERLN